MTIPKADRVELVRSYCAAGAELCHQIARGYLLADDKNGSYPPEIEVPLLSFYDEENYTSAEKKLAANKWLDVVEDNFKNSEINRWVLHFIREIEYHLALNVEYYSGLIRDESEDSATAFSIISNRNNFLRYISETEKLVLQHVTEHARELLRPDEIIKSARRAAEMDVA